LTSSGNSDEGDAVGLAEMAMSEWRAAKRSPDAFQIRYGGSSAWMLKLSRCRFRSEQTFDGLLLNGVRWWRTDDRIEGTDLPSLRQITSGNQRREVRSRRRQIRMCLLSGSLPDGETGWSQPLDVINNLA